MSKITLDQLIVKKACYKQVSLFKQYFGSEVEVSVERALEVAQIFEWDWAAVKFLNKEQYNSYVDIIQPAWESYDAVIKQAWKTYRDANQEWKSHLHEKQEWEAYLHAKQQALATYNRSKAESFARTYLGG